MNCPMCRMRAELDDLTARHTADRIALGQVWIDGGMLNHKPTPTVIMIDCPIGDDDRSELMALLRTIELRHAKEQKS